MASYKSIDIFAGIGGIRMGFAAKNADRLLSRVNNGDIAYASGHDSHSGESDARTREENVYSLMVNYKINDDIVIGKVDGTINFVYEIEGLSDAKLVEIRRYDTLFQAENIAHHVLKTAKNVKFMTASCEGLVKSLVFVDSRFCEVLAHSLVYYYRDGVAKCVDVVEKLERENPLRVPGKGFYRYKYKDFLCRAVLSAQSLKSCANTNGRGESYVLISTCENVQNQEIYTANFFREYVLEKTRHEWHVGGQQMLANLCKENGKTYLQLAV